VEAFVALVEKLVLVIESLDVCLAHPLNASTSAHRHHLAQMDNDWLRGLCITRGQLATEDRSCEVNWQSYSSFQPSPFFGRALQQR
jgi:hypothetical protein